MEEYSHFLLGANFASQSDDFQPKFSPIEGLPLPERDRYSHYEVIKNAYDSAISSGIDVLNQFQNENNVSADGVYLDVNLANGGDSLKSLDSKRSARLMNVTTLDDDDQKHSSKATVYLPTDKTDWLDKKLDNYRDPNKDNIHGPSGYTLINDINSIRCSSIESFLDPVTNSTIYDPTSEIGMNSGLPIWLMILFQTPMRNYAKLELK